MTNDDDYEVGYRKPPKNSRFKKGQSGNPKGRKKAEPKSFMDALRAEGGTMVTVNIEGKAVRLSKDELAVKSMYQKIFKGDPATMRLITNLKMEEAAIKAAHTPVSFTLNFGDDDDVTKPWNQHKISKQNSELSSSPMEPSPTTVPTVTPSASMLLIESDAETPQLKPVAERDEILPIKVKRKLDLPKFKRKIPKHIELD